MSRRTDWRAIAIVAMMITAVWLAGYNGSRTSYDNQVDQCDKLLNDRRLAHRRALTAMDYWDAVRRSAGVSDSIEVAATEAAEQARISVVEYEQRLPRRERTTIQAQVYPEFDCSTSVESPSLVGGLG